MWWLVGLSIKIGLVEVEEVQSVFDIFSQLGHGRHPEKTKLECANLP